MDGGLEGGERDGVVELPDRPALRVPEDAEDLDGLEVARGLQAALAPEDGADAPGARLDLRGEVGVAGLEGARARADLDAVAVGDDPVVPGDRGAGVGVGAEEQGLVVVEAAGPAGGVVGAGLEQLRPPQVGAAQVGAAQVGVAQVGALQVGAAQVGAAQVSVAQVGADDPVLRLVGPAARLEPAVVVGEQARGQGLQPGEALQVVAVVDEVLLGVAPADRRGVVSRRALMCWRRLSVGGPSWSSSRSAISVSLSR